MFEQRVPERYEQVLELGQVPEVEPVAEAAAPEPARVDSAILVIHGMGQQLPFETLDTVTSGIRRVKAPTKVHAETGVIEADGERIRRIELKLPTDDGTRRVDIYEAYWAPLTEGRVGIRDVLSFLLSGGWNGVRMNLDGFHRWMFGRDREFSRKWAPLVVLIVALVVVSSLVLLNLLAAAVAARVPWVTQGNMVGDSRVILNFVLLQAAFLAYLLAMTSVVRPWRRLQRAVGGVATSAMYALLLVLVLSPFGLLIAITHNAAGVSSEIRKATAPMLYRVLPPISPELLEAEQSRSSRGGGQALAGAIVLAVLLSMLALGRIVAASAGRTKSPQRRKDSARLKRSAPVVAIVLGAAATLMALSVVFHLYYGWVGPADQDPRVRTLWSVSWASPQILPPRVSILSIVFLLSLLVIVAGFLLRTLTRAPERNGTRRTLRLLHLPEGIALLIVACLLPVVWFDVFPADIAADDDPRERSVFLLPWLLVLGMSLFVKSFLVEYVGDVAAYISAHRLDRFHDIREEIKEVTARVVRAIYGMRAGTGEANDAASGENEKKAEAPPLLYSRIAVVAHSLGSVIAYDAVNQMIVEDEVGAKGLNASGRTKLLVTFGSPLDKTAFIFTASSRNTENVREALASSVQPLIWDEKYRKLCWFNLHSPHDIISGPLNYYDPPEESVAHPVHNIVDEQCGIPLAAHTEYWRNDALYRGIVRWIEGANDCKTLREAFESSSGTIKS
ncbi:MAG TPA: hypothetical protein VMT00_14830 [Thermoanaerobaculia bacterium]|nr:hypothetical protein [Thermoanaerobaculia bacterium]